MTCHKPSRAPTKLSIDPKRPMVMSPTHLLPLPPPSYFNILRSLLPQDLCTSCLACLEVPSQILTQPLPSGHSSVSTGVQIHLVWNSPRCSIIACSSVSNFTFLLCLVPLEYKRVPSVCLICHFPLYWRQRCSVVTVRTNEKCSQGAKNWGGGIAPHFSSLFRRLLK
jgi:hypothetical protein